MRTLTIHFEDEHERNRKLVVIMEKLGYTVTANPVERISVGELARRVNRRVSTVSRSLRRAGCPPFVGKQGKRRLIWIEPTRALLAYLETPTARMTTPTRTL